jgi:GTP-binding protein LepA
MKNIRNFCIISHIDHGKSTLADRLLELTGTVEKRKMREQILDSMELEREKGITIKLQPARMDYKGYVLNLIDTPGHVDFSYEVSRSLAAVEGALLLVDATQGVQAQTLANLHLAQEQKLTVIPVVNKIDMAIARTEETVQEVCQLLNVAPEQVLKISAKQGTNAERVLEAIVEKISSPAGDSQKPFRALIFDSEYDTYKGVVAYIRVVDGQIKKGQKVSMFASKTETEVIELGVFKPEMKPVDCLAAGEIGYLATGLKDIGRCRVGDTIFAGGNVILRAKPEESRQITTKSNNGNGCISRDSSSRQGGTQNDISPLAGYREPQPVVFAGFYPTDADEYDLLKDGLSKLKLNDAALQYEPESSEGLGRGFRCGFLGMLHMEIISERLKREFGLNLVIASPSVRYQVTLKQAGKNLNISSPSEMPEPSRVQEIKEPWADLEVLAPSQYLGPAMKLLSGLRGEYQDTQYLTPERILIKYQVPLSEIIVNFYDKLKNITSGYGSMNYRLIDYRLADLVKIDILAAGEKAEAFSQIVHQSAACQEARRLVEKLKELIPKHHFSIPLQAVINGKVIARETISALRKDVIAGLYGGDYTRKKKLLEKQKKGKKKMKEIGRVKIPQEVFLKALKK